MDKEFANKTLLITGATSGIGKATRCDLRKQAQASPQSEETSRRLRWNFRMQARAGGLSVSRLSGGSCRRRVKLTR